VPPNNATARSFAPIPDLMFVLRRDGTYVDYHARDSSVIFIPPEKFLGRTVRDIFSPDLAETVMEAIERCCVTGEAVVVEFELDIGYLRYNEARLVALANDQVLSIVRDVTEARRARELKPCVSRAADREPGGRAPTDCERTARRSEPEDRRAQHRCRSAVAPVASAEHRTRLRRISAQVAEIAEHLHDLSYELHPARLQTLGLLESLRVMCSEFSHQRNIDVTFTAADSELPLVIDPDCIVVRVPHHAGSTSQRRAA
jgi:signal transduction histidine kinase